MRTEFRTEDQIRNDQLSNEMLRRALIADMGVFVSVCAVGLSIWIFGKASVIPLLLSLAMVGCLVATFHYLAQHTRLVRSQELFSLRRSLVRLGRSLREHVAVLRRIWTRAPYGTGYVPQRRTRPEPQGAPVDLAS